MGPWDFLPFLHVIEHVSAPDEWSAGNWLKRSPGILVQDELNLKQLADMTGYFGLGVASPTHNFLLAHSSTKKN